MACVTLYKAPPAARPLGHLFVARGLDTADDPGGYAPSPGVQLAVGGGAYFASDEAYAVVLAATRRYRNGIIVATLPETRFDSLRLSGGILPDPLLAPRAGFRVQPHAFAAFNAATTAPDGSRSHHPPGSTLPGGSVVP